MLAYEHVTSLDHVFIFGIGYVKIMCQIYAGYMSATRVVCRLYANYLEVTRRLFAQKFRPVISGRLRKCHSDPHSTADGHLRMRVYYPDDWPVDVPANYADALHRKYGSLNLLDPRIAIKTSFDENHSGTVT